MQEAKLYGEFGWWKYYRTPSGETFAVRSGRDYWYVGNPVKGVDACVYIPKEKHSELFDRVKFVEVTK